MAGFAPVEPQRALLVNVETGEEMPVLANPPTFSEGVMVNYSRGAVPGLDHQVLQYQGTGNRTLNNIAFTLDSQIEPAEAGYDISDFRRFLLELTVPSFLESAPPRVLFIWPGVVTIETVIITVAFQYLQFGSAGVLAYTATCAFEEILDSRRTGEQLRAEG